MSVTFADLLTAAGAGVAAGIITTLISIIKTSFPFAANWHGAALAFVFSAALYLLAAFATSVGTLDAGLAVFIAWLTCASAAVGLHEVVAKPAISRIKGDS